MQELWSEAVARVNYFHPEAVARPISDHFSRLSGITTSFINMRLFIILPENYFFSEPPTYLYLGVSQILDHSGVWPKVSLVFEDFMFRISEGYRVSHIELDFMNWL